MAESKHRKWTVTALACGMFLLLFVLAALNAFNLPFLRPHGTGEIFLFTALSVLVFLLLLTLLVLLFRNVVKLLADQQSRVLGSRIRSRMLVGALLVSFTPAVFMFLFSFLLLNRSMERWFSQPASQLRQDSTRVAVELSQYVAANARAEAESLASSPSLTQALEAQNHDALLVELRTHRITLEGGFAVVYHDRIAVSQYQLPREDGPALIRPSTNDILSNGPDPSPGSGPLTAVVLEAAQRSDQPALVVGNNDYILGAASTEDGGVVVVGLPMPGGLSATIADIRSGARDYSLLYRMRNRVRSTYVLLLVLLTALTFFASSWLALFLSKQVTRPVEALADAMDEIAAGHYAHRVRVETTEELGELVQVVQPYGLPISRKAALWLKLPPPSSPPQIARSKSAAASSKPFWKPSPAAWSPSILRCACCRRIEPSRLCSLRATGTMSQACRSRPFSRREIADELILLVRRSHRMGVAATEIELSGLGGVRNVTATVATLELGNDRQGCILVLEDVTEFLRAQRQVAWKEVAQRVAHEIKNPLTPIALSAERIRKHVDRTTPESPNVVRKCSEVILASVETLRRLVDQFAALAQFPTSQPRASDLNTIVKSALSLFAGRLNKIRIVEHLGPNIPPVLADPEAMKRALANLIDNAAEAMQSSLLRELTIETGMIEGHTMAEIVIADTGHGLNDEMRERLFLPYFSTKRRGSGLGLTIAAKIVQEHHGAIRAEQNTPAGARFIIELPLAEQKSHGTRPG